jgi:hypothetical protein
MFSHDGCQLSGNRKHYNHLNMKLSLYFFVCVLFLCRVHALTYAVNTVYQEMNLAPGVSSRIQIDPDIPIIQMCLTKCSNKQECKSVVYGDQICSLHNTTDGLQVLDAGHKMVAKISTSVRDKG